MSDKKKLLIIDGFALIFRAYYALIKSTSFTTITGEPTGAIFGFIRMILSALTTLKPDYVVVAWDLPGKTFRNDIYSDYKANRKETPKELVIQIPQIIEAINKFGISSLTKENYEADDVIGTLCEKMRNKENLDATILSGDKDLLQLVGDNIMAMANKRGVSEFKIYDREAVKEKWGVYPEKIVDLFSLIGDSSDNIPGVKGIGNKSAVTLINDYNSLENVFSNINKIKNKRIKTVLEKDNSLESAQLSKSLVEIKRDLDLDFDLENFKTYDFTTEEAIEIYDKFELKSIKNGELLRKKDDKIEIVKLSEKEKQASKPKNHEIIYDKTGQFDLFASETDKTNTIQMKVNNKKGKYKLITSKAEFDNILQEIKKAKILSFDFETTSEKPVEAEAIGFSLSWKETEALYIPIKHSVETDFQDEDIKEFLLKIFKSNEIKIVGQNLKYEYIILRNMGIKPENFYFDTMIAAYVLDPDASPFNMDILAEKLLKYKTIKYKDIVPKKQTLLDINIDMVLEYACEDADITLRLHNVLKPQIDNSKMKNIYYDIEMKLIQVLGKMELAGVSINTDYFTEMSIEMEKELNRLQKEIYKLNDNKEFNINSTKQLQEILFDKLGLKSIKKTTKGARSTDVHVLEELAKEHDIPKLILQYRTIAKLKNTYVDTLPKVIYSKTGRIHSSFNQTITATGRLSSTNPNMQNIPIKGDLGKKIRKGFIPSKRNLLLSADYSQIELRLLAHFSNEPKLIDAYKKGKDLHIQTAALLFNKKEEDITFDERLKGKTINFSIIYGIGARKLGSDLDIKTKEAKKLIDFYFEQYSKVMEFINKQREEVKKELMVYTLFNRVRHIKQFKSKRRVDISSAERLSVNSPIQGTSADLIKLAMIKIMDEFKKKKLESKMIIQVHDELVFDIVKKEIDDVKKIVIDAMENVASLKVPLKVNVQIGNNWDEAH